MWSRTIRWRQRLLFALALAPIGVVVVSWALLAAADDFAERRESTPDWIVSVPPDWPPLRGTLRFPLGGASIVDMSQGSTVVYRRAGVTVCSQSVGRIHDELLRKYAIYRTNRTTCGFPFPALGFATRIRSDLNGTAWVRTHAPAPWWERGISLEWPKAGFSAGERPGYPTPDWKRLPVHLVLPGFAINLVLYWAGFAAVLLAPSLIRVHARLRRGACPRCGYAAPPDNLCPECAFTSPPLRPGATVDAT